MLSLRSRGCLRVCDRVPYSNPKLNTYKLLFFAVVVVLYMNNISKNRLIAMPGAVQSQTYFYCRLRRSVDAFRDEASIE